MLTRRGFLSTLLAAPLAAKAALIASPIAWKSKLWVAHSAQERFIYGLQALENDGTYRHSYYGIRRG